MNYCRRIIRKVRKSFSFDEDDRAETGIGMLIIFIAMILVAAVAAAVLLHTVAILQTRATSTGTQTIQQVSCGISVTGVVGFDNATPPASGGISELLIFIKPVGGSPAINVANISLELSIGSSTAILQYNNQVFDNQANGTSNIFSGAAWKNLSNKDKTSFGVFVASDPQKSLTNLYPILSDDDIVGLMINVTSSFGSNITEGSTLIGELVLPVGATAAQINIIVPNDFGEKTITLE